jgi:hypothetical protein
MYVNCLESLKVKVKVKELRLQQLNNDLVEDLHTYIHVL